jgi:dephospho-CoA kinase
MVFLGIGGKNCAGKDTAAEYLIKKGFKYYSLSDEIREILNKEKIPITRENLIFYANEYRKKYGPDFFAKKVIQKIDKKNNAVIVSIRNLAELQELKKLPFFYFIIIQADPKIRFERMLKRSRESDPKTLEEFLKFELAEENQNENAQQLSKIVKLGDFYIENNSTKDELYKKIDDVLLKIQHLNKQNLNKKE